MATMPKQMPSKPKEQPETGAVEGICVAVVELGFQKEGGQYGKAESEADLQYDGMKVKPKVVPVYEIDQQITDGEYKGKNMQVSVSNFGVNISSHESKRNLGYWHKGTTGAKLEEGDDYTVNMVGRRVMLNLVEGKNGYVDLESAMPLKKGSLKPNRIQFIDGKAPEGFEGVEEFKPHENMQNTIDGAIPIPKLIEANKKNQPMVDWLTAIELAG